MVATSTFSKRLIFMRARSDELEYPAAGEGCRVELWSITPGETDIDEAAGLASVHPLHSEGGAEK